MNIAMCGVNYRSCPLELRSQLAFTRSQLKAALKECKRYGECVLLSTCNRTELYWRCSDRDDPEAGFLAMARRLCRYKGVESERLLPYFYMKYGDDAVTHLFTVASGLDSLAFGEDQILGQIKTAHSFALWEKACAGEMDKLFSMAQTTAKRVKSQTPLSQLSCSTGGIAAKIVKQAHSGAYGVLLIGVGETGVLTLKNLNAEGIQSVYATNRTKGRLEDLSGLFADIRVVDYARRYEAVAYVDCIISCTASPHYTIQAEKLEKVYHGRPLTIVDLAVPPDVEAGVGALENVTLWNMDDIGKIIERNTQEKLSVKKQAQEIIAQGVAALHEYERRRSSSAIIQELEKEKAAIITRQMEKFHISPERREETQAILTAAINEILGKAVYSIQSFAEPEESQAFFRLIAQALHREGRNNETER